MRTFRMSLKNPGEGASVAEEFEYAGNANDTAAAWVAEKSNDVNWNVESNALVIAIEPDDWTVWVFQVPPPAVSPLLNESEVRHS
jgi:hypothetical protein